MLEANFRNHSSKLIDFKVDWKIVSLCTEEVFLILVVYLNTKVPMIVGF